MCNKIKYSELGIYKLFKVNLEIYFKFNWKLLFIIKSEISWLYAISKEKFESTSLLKVPIYLESFNFNKI